MKRKMILAGWEGFTKFDISSVSEDWVNNSVTYLSVEELPVETQWNLMLKKQIHETLNIIDILRGCSKELFGVDMFTLKKETEEMSNVIAKAFTDYPDNSFIENYFANLSLEDLSNADIDYNNSYYEFEKKILTSVYVSHLTRMDDMSDPLTGARFGLDYYCVLALMLIHEAVRLKGEKSRIAAVEATDVFNYSLHERINAARMQFWEKHWQTEGTKEATKARLVNPKAMQAFVKKACMSLCGEVRNVPYSGALIARKIEAMVIKEAERIGYHFKSNDKYRTIYDWVLSALKDKKYSP